MISRFLPAAEKELDADSEWYNRRVSGLGREFVLAVQATVREVELDPLRFEITNPRLRNRVLRRARVERFPYDVIFEVEAEEILIIAVAHHARRPGYSRRRR